MPSGSSKRIMSGRGGSGGGRKKKNSPHQQLQQQQQQGKKKKKGQGSLSTPIEEKPQDFKPEDSKPEQPKLKEDPPKPDESAVVKDPNLEQLKLVSKDKPDQAGEPPKQEKKKLEDISKPKLIVVKREELKIDKLQVRDMNDNEVEGSNSSVLSPDAKPFIFKPNDHKKDFSPFNDGVVQQLTTMNVHVVIDGDSRPTSPVPVEEIDYSNIKHPLHSGWTLWYFCQDGKKDWEHCLQQVYTVHFVEDFWSLYHHVSPPSELRSGCDYSFFREGIKPMWEDVRNVKGGRWLLSKEKKFRQDWIDETWKEILLFLVGDALQETGEGPHINGAVVNLRNKADKVALWLDTKNGELIRSIGMKLQQVLKADQPICYEIHEDTMQKTGSVSKAFMKL